MDRGGAEVAAWFKAEFKERNWKGRMRANKAGCLDACEFGPAVVVYPEGIWYSPRTQEEVRKICDHHLVIFDLAWNIHIKNDPTGDIGCVQ